MDDLSKRELQILSLFASGFSSREISENLYLSPNTIRSHLQHIYNKLGLESYKGTSSQRINAVKWYFNKKLEEKTFQQILTIEELEKQLALEQKKLKKIEKLVQDYEGLVIESKYILKILESEN